MGSAAISSSAQKKAASTAASSANRATDIEYEMYRQSRKDLAPWRKQGAKAVNQLATLVKRGPGKFRESPSYQFALEEGLEGANRAMSGMGLGRSGAHVKAATDYAKNMASTEYDNFLRRYYNSLTPYQSLANLGQTSGVQTGQNAMQAGQVIGNTAMAAGNATAAGQLGVGNTLANTMQWGAQQYMDYSNQTALRNALTQNRAATTGPTGGYYDMPQSVGKPWYDFY